MRIEEEKEEEKILLLGGWEEGLKGFFDAAASLDERGVCVWYYMLALSSSRRASTLLG